MKVKTVLAALLVSTLPLGTALAYDGLAEDYKTCTTGKGKVVVAACTRLIDNSQKENSLVGLFYAIRASNNTDKALNCKDTKKARKLITDPKLQSAIDELEAINC
jgi:hypothetical protein